MAKKDSRVDAYIAKSADFARPILNRIRRLVHAACPDVEETLKWNSPFYLHNGILLGTPAFKEHCALIFWKRKLIFKKGGIRGSGLGQFARITAPADLPGDKILTGYIRKAVKLNEADVKNPSGIKKEKREVAVPGYFLAALKKNKKALTTFENFSPSHRREYIEWIAGARLEETRGRRIKKAIEWLAKGKSRNSKYQ